jgi:L-rhamnose mutarotase
VRHSPIWAELHRAIKAHGAHDYSIYLHPETLQLFAYVEIEDEARWADIAKTAICQKWWKYMGEIMPANADSVPLAKD